MIVVYDFAVAPGEVQEQKAGQLVAAAFAKHLVAEIQDLGLPAEHAADGAPVAQGSVAIDGQFVSIDEGQPRRSHGDRPRRRPQRRAGAGPGDTPLEQLEVDANSGRKPGAAAMLGVGAVAGHLAFSAVAAVGTDVASETLPANVDDDADRAAKGVAKHLAVFFTQQGWIAES